MPKSKTHFEQIPVDVVKRIAEKDPAPREEVDKAIAETPPKKTEPYFVRSNFLYNIGVGK